MRRSTSGQARNVAGDASGNHKQYRGTLYKNSSGPTNGRINSAESGSAVTSACRSASDSNKLPPSFGMFPNESSGASLIGVVRLTTTTSLPATRYGETLVVRISCGSPTVV